jgi:hypothetical protein
LHCKGWKPAIGPRALKPKLQIVVVVVKSRADQNPTLELLQFFERLMEMQREGFE